PVSAALLRVRRGRAGPRLRGRSDGDVPVRHRVCRAPHGVTMDGRAKLAGDRIGTGRGRAPGGDRGRDRPQGGWRTGTFPRRRRRLRHPELYRAPLPDRPPARLRDHLDRPAGRRDRRSHPRSALPDGHGRGATAVMGPGTAWYLSVAGFLFGVGTLGVLIRRNPLIVLLSLEIMLNGANLALIAFARHLN